MASRASRIVLHFDEYPNDRLDDQALGNIVGKFNNAVLDVVRDVQLLDPRIRRDALTKVWYRDNLIPSANTSKLQAIPGLVGPKDLTMEEYREYVLPGGTVYRIDNPIAFYYREGGTTHRVVTEGGIVHCVPFGGDTVLRWKNRDISEPVTY